MTIDMKLFNFNPRSIDLLNQGALPNHLNTYIIMWLYLSHVQPIPLFVYQVHTAVISLSLFRLIFFSSIKVPLVVWLLICIRISGRIFDIQKQILL